MKSIKILKTEGYTTEQIWQKLNKGEVKKIVEIPVKKMMADMIRLNRNYMPESD